MECSLIGLVGLRTSGCGLNGVSPLVLIFFNKTYGQTLCEKLKWRGYYFSTPNGPSPIDFYLKTGSSKHILCWFILKYYMVVFFTCFVQNIEL